jgi:hypothetical protein
MNLKKFLKVIAQVAPAVLVAVPGGAALAPFIPTIVAAIGAAEATGASGPDKKAQVLQVVPEHLQTVAGAGIDAVVCTVNTERTFHDPELGTTVIPPGCTGD